MHILLKMILACLFFFCFSSSVSSQVYKWRDKDGNLIISSTPPPPGVQSEKRDMEQSPRTDANARDIRERKDAIQDAEPARSNRDIKVVLYIADWCPFCKKARTYLDSLGVNLTEYDVEKDPERRKDYLRKGNNETSVPLIDIEGIILRGFDKDGILAALDERRRTGYQY